MFSGIRVFPLAVCATVVVFASMGPLSYGCAIEDVESAASMGREATTPPPALIASGNQFLRSQYFTSLDVTLVGPAHIARPVLAAADENSVNMSGAIASDLPDMGAALASLGGDDERQIVFSPISDGRGAHTTMPVTIILGWTGIREPTQAGGIEDSPEPVSNERRLSLPAVLERTEAILVGVVLMGIGFLPFGGNLGRAPAGQKLPADAPATAVPCPVSGTAIPQRWGVIPRRRVLPPIVIGVLPAAALRRLPPRSGL